MQNKGRLTNKDYQWSNIDNVLNLKIDFSFNDILDDQVRIKIENALMCLVNYENISTDLNCLKGLVERDRVIAPKAKTSVYDGESYEHCNSCGAIVDDQRFCHCCGQRQQADDKPCKLVR